MAARLFLYDVVANQAVEFAGCGAGGWVLSNPEDIQKFLVHRDGEAASDEDEFTDLLLVTEKWVKWDTEAERWVGVDGLAPQERVLASMSSILGDLTEARDQYGMLDYMLRQATTKLHRLVHINAGLSKAQRA